MSIELNERKKFSPVGIIVQLFSIVAVLVFLISTGIFIYYQFFKIPQNTIELAGLYTYLREQKPEEQKRTEIEALVIQNTVDDYRTLLRQRSKLSKFFGHFEQWIHPQVYFSSFSIDAGARAINLKGYSTDFKPLIDQLEIIKQEPMIERHQISDILLTEGKGVSFSLTITAKPETIK